MSRRTAAAALCVCALTATAHAQTADRGAPQLFGRAPSHGSQQLDVSVSEVGAYDDNIVAAIENGGVDPRTQRSGTYNALSTQITYTRRGRHLQFGASESSSVRYYPSLGDVSTIQHLAGVGLSGSVGTTRIRINQTLGYAPYFSFAPQAILFEPAPGSLPLSVAGSVMTRMDARTLGSSADLSQPLGGRTTLQLTSTFQDTDFQHDGSGLRTTMLSGRVVRNLSRDIGLVLGYGYQQGTYRVNPLLSQIVTFQNIDLGLDFHRALSVTRRLAFTATTGSTIVRGLDGSSEYRVIGDAKLTRQIGRSWQAGAAYHRGVDLLDGFGQPFFQDSLTFSAGGSLNQRVELSMAAGYAKGQLGLSASGAGVNHDDNYNGSARLRMALSRTLAFTMEYSLYSYHFDRMASLPLGLPSELRRQGVRAGFDLWLPVVH